MWCFSTLPSETQSKGSTASVASGWRKDECWVFQCFECPLVLIWCWLGNRNLGIPISPVENLYQLLWELLFETSGGRESAGEPDTQGSHKPGIVREFCKPGKVREFEIWSGIFFMTSHGSRLAYRWVDLCMFCLDWISFNLGPLMMTLICWLNRIYGSQGLATCPVNVSQIVKNHI